MKLIMPLLIIALFTGCYARDPEETGLEGKSMPQFTLQLMDSTHFLNSASIPTGKAAAIFCFNPYCPYCKAQMDEIIEDMDVLKDLHFYLVSDWPLKDMRTFYKTHKLAQYPNITIGRDTAHFVAEYFEAQGVPFIAIYGKDKRLKEAYLGKVYGRQIKKAAER